MNKKNKKEIKKAIALAFIALLFILFIFLKRNAVSISESKELLEFPVEIRGYYLIEKVYGKKAIRILSEMHKAGLEIKDAYVLKYINEDGREIIIYIAVAESKNKAEKLFERMTERIKNNGGEIEKIEIDNKTAYFLQGFGFESNFYYLSGNRVIWVSANEDIESPEIREIVKNL